MLKVQEWGLENPERRRANAILHTMRKNSRKRGWPRPEFTTDEVVAACRGYCAQTGIKFTFEPNGAAQRNPWVASPDRINNDDWYRKENVQWVCWMYNAMKNSFSANQVATFIHALKHPERQQSHA